MNKNEKRYGMFEGLGPCRSQMLGEVVPGLVLGTTGKSYRGREVVSCLVPPGLFGTRKNGRAIRALYTLHKGILNQCSLPKDGGKPSPYWAVMDAMSELSSGFRRADAMELAVKAAGEDKRKACCLAWDVLRNHHRHARKRDAGMAFMVDSKDRGRLFLRARDPGETLQFFEAQGRLRADAEEAMKTARTMEASGAEAEPPAELGGFGGPARP